MGGEEDKRSVRGRRGEEQERAERSRRVRAYLDELGLLLGKLGLALLHTWSLLPLRLPLVLRLLLHLVLPLVLGLLLGDADGLCLASRWRKCSHHLTHEHGGRNHDRSTPHWTGQQLSQEL